VEKSLKKKIKAHSGGGKKVDLGKNKIFFEVYSKYRALYPSASKKTLGFEMRPALLTKGVDLGPDAIAKRLGKLEPREPASSKKRT
jgi:hypothetical protein